jgi:hypothetical protein
MATVTLVQAAAHNAANIHQMTAQPMNVLLTGLAGGAIQFQCTNAFAALQGARSVHIVYNAAVPQQPENIQVSSVMP